jgi:hypothetical protein
MMKILMVENTLIVKKALIIQKTLGVEIIQPVQMLAVRAPGNDHSSHDKGGREAEPYHGLSLPNGAETSQLFPVSDPVHLFASHRFAVGLRPNSVRI